MSVINHAKQLIQDVNALIYNAIDGRHHNAKDAANQFLLCRRMEP